MMQTNNLDFKVPEMRTIQQCADASGLSYSYIRKLCITDQIVHVRAGKKFLINMPLFISFLNGE